MSIIDILLNISPALEQGKSLENASTWNNVATLNHALVTVFGFGLILAKQFGYDLPISDDQLAELAAAVASVGMSVAAFLHHAANPNSGLKRK